MKMLKIILMGSLLLPMTALAESGVKKVSGSYTYYGDKNDSPAMSKRKALEGARLDAMSKEFGTIVSQDVLQADRIGSNGETNKFFSLSSTEVQGEWIADNGEPQYTVSLDPEDNLVVSCKISGTAKALSNESVNFNALALRNGSTKGNASTEYHTGDNLYLYFCAPVDGYVMVYLMDEKGEVAKMLPYTTDPKQEVKVKKDYDYVFFDDKKGTGTFGDPDLFEIATAGDIEFNKLYVIFSPNAFTPPMMNPARSADELPYVTEEEFARWMVKNRKNDQKMSVKQINLKLYPD